MNFSTLFSTHFFKTFDESQTFIGSKKCDIFGNIKNEKRSS